MLNEKGARVMSKKENGFNIKLYAILTFVIVAALLAVITVTTFSARYTAFHPEKLAETYVDSIVQTGDGYNAYKNTIVSKNGKYGDFIRENYIYPAIYRKSGFVPGDDRDGLVGYNDKSFIGEKTANDDGTLTGELIEKMYVTYAELVEKAGWDNYGMMFTEYIAKLIETREEIFGDKYLTDEIFFTAFESNVSTYGKMLTGTDDEYDANTGVQLSEKSVGEYEKAFGADYRITVNVVAETPVDLEAYKENVNTTLFEEYRINPEQISDAKILTADVLVGEGEALTTVSVTVVKIGRSWYVDNTVTDTSMLYKFYK